ncbi:dihydrolipoamide dehydrogenase [Arthrobacter sp. B2I5]|nr:dihydrolipoamide dehydrogenase [Arthrobacter sp. B2I5]
MADQATAQEFDILVLGGGSGGYAAALRGVQLGLTVGLVEKGKLGGTCLHNGCIPTKALLHSAELADHARDSAKYGVNVTLDSIDINAVNAYKDGIIAGKFKGLQGLIKSKGITVIEGEGKLQGTDTVVVNGTAYKGKNIVLATGSYSRTLPGLEIGGKVITSDQALTMDFIPKSAIILGGGVIGVEFASVWKSFGVDVTIVEGLPSLVPNEDATIIKNFERAFKKRGIKFSTGVFFQGVEQNDDGVKVTLVDGKTFEADLLLVAVGRGPVTANLGYEEAGVTIDRGFVITNERLHTGVGNIYAVGDIVPGVQLAHRGYQQGIFVAEEIAGLKPVVVEDINIPKVTYSEPEIATVGYTEKGCQGKVRRRPGTDPGIQPGRQRQELHPGHLRPGQAGPPEGRPRGGRPHDRRTHGRAGGRGPADRELGSVPGGRGTAGARPPHPERSPRRSPSGAGRQAAARLGFPSITRPGAPGRQDRVH